MINFIFKSKFKIFRDSQILKFCYLSSDVIYLHPPSFIASSTIRDVSLKLKKTLKTIRY